MFGFTKKVRKGTTAEKVDRYKVIYNLAKCCYDDAMRRPEIGNISLYNALSHLVQVSELKVNMVLYDHLQFNTKKELDTKSAEYVKLQIEHLKLIIAGL